MASIFHGLLTPWLAPKFPKFFKHGYEPLFFNASLSFIEKIEKWENIKREKIEKMLRHNGKTPAEIVTSERLADKLSRRLA